MTKKELLEKVEELERRVGELERRPIAWPLPWQQPTYPLPTLPPQRVTPDWTYRPVPPFRPWEITC